MEELGKITKSKDVSLETKTKISMPSYSQLVCMDAKVGQ